MIQKTPAEKQQLKEAKAAYKAGKKQAAIASEEFKKQEQIPFNTTGILPTEKLLPDYYPVFLDHVYVIDHGEGKVIRSDVAGTIAYLKRDLQKRGFIFENIYNCHVSARRGKN